MHILLVLITAWICLNKPEKDLVVMRIPNSPEFQMAHHLQYIRLALSNLLIRQIIDT